MEQRQSEKIVPVNDKQYKLTKVDARTACWLYSFLAAKAINGQLLKALGLCSQEEFYSIQTIALKGVYSMEEKDGNIFPVAVLDHRNGSFTDPILRDDSAAVFKLTSESLFFNLQPFLVESGSASPNPPL